MTVLIIEDEIPAGKRLEKLLNQKGFVVLSIIVSVKNAVKWFQENSQPEFIFLDIKLRDGNSFDLFDKVEITSKIVFTTAFDEFALKAFEFNAIDYLLKPIDEKKLDKLILKIKNFKGKESVFKSTFFKESLQEKFKSSFLVAVGNSLKKIETHEIKMFFSDTNATFIQTNQDRIFALNYSLEKLERDLDSDYFFRINRKYLINRNYIDKVFTKDQLSVSLENDKDDLKISRLKSRLFIDWFKKSV